MTTEAEVIAGLRKELRDARRIISATHKNPVVHTNCEVHNCPICDGGLFQCADCGAAEIETETRVCSVALQAPQEAGVSVKALDWRDHRGQTFPDTWTAQTPCGVYEIEERSASDSPAYVATGPLHVFLADKDSLEAAKAAAQADFDKRIRSALSQPVATPAPSQDAAVVERARNELVIDAYRAMDAIDAIRRWCDGQAYENDTITVAKLRGFLPSLASTRPAEAQAVAEGWREVEVNYLLKGRRHSPAYFPATGEKCEVSGPNCDDASGYTWASTTVMWQDDIFVLYGSSGFWPVLHKHEHVIFRPLAASPATGGA